MGVLCKSFEQPQLFQILTDARLSPSSNLVTLFTIVAHQKTPLLIRLTKLMQFCYDLLWLDFFSKYTVYIH